MKCDDLNWRNPSDGVGELLQVQHFLGKLIAKDISIGFITYCGLGYSNLWIHEKIILGSAVLSSG